MKFKKNLIAVLFVFLFVGIVSATPNQPTLNSPADGSTGISTSPVLNFSVSNGFFSSNMNVTLYSVTTDEVLNTWTNVASGTDLNYTWEHLNKNVTYEWYVNATDNGGTTQGDTWNFTTEDNFNVSSCVELWSPGSYNLINNIINTDDDVCIKINGVNISFNGNNFSINNTKTGYSNGFLINNSNNVKIKNCNISSFEYAFNISESNNSVLDNNNLFNNTYGVYSYKGFKSNITSNSFVNSLKAIYSSYSDNNLILGNSVLNSSTSNSIRIDYSNNNIIKNNNVTNGYSSLYLAYSNDSNVSNNNFVHAKSDSLILEHSNRIGVYNNNISFTTDVGLWLFNENHDTIITNNTICCANHGVTISSSHGVLFNDNVVYNNNAGSQDWGFSLTSSTDCNILNNNISYNGRNFVLASSSNNLIKSNIIDLALVDYGLFVFNSNNNNLEDNIITNSTEADFYSKSNSQTYVINMIFTKTVASFIAKDVTMSYVDKPPASPEYQDNGQAFISIVNNSENVWIDLNLYFNPSTVYNKNKVAMWKYDVSWKKLDSEVNTFENYVHYNITSFSIFGLFEDVTPPFCPLEEEPTDLSIYSTSASGSCCVDEGIIRYYWVVGDNIYTKDELAVSGCLNVTGGVVPYAVKNNPEWLKWLVIFFVFLAIYFVYMW